MYTKSNSLIFSVLVFVVAVVLTYAIVPADVKTIRISDVSKGVSTEEEVVTTIQGKGTEECPMNGILYPKEQRVKWEGRRPLGIVVENSFDARPQSGISTADVVYEMIAEGGITRFLLIYYCQDAKYIGPVRSARIYFIRLIQGYGEYPLFAHVGGANTPGPANALGEIEDLGWEGYNDLNQFSVPFPNYWRDYERLPNVAVEHTMYTDSTKLWDFAEKYRKLSNVDRRGVPWNKDFKGWSFEDDAPKNDRGDIKSIGIEFALWDGYSGKDYDVTWRYDVESNSYMRLNGGKPHKDKNTGKQLNAKNVVVVFTKQYPANDGYENGTHLLYQVVGSGNATVYKNGKAIKAIWSKPTPTSMMTFADASGKEIKFTRGQIFIEIVNVGTEIVLE